MELAYKISGGAVMGLAVLAALLFLIEQVGRPAPITASAPIEAGVGGERIEVRPHRAALLREELIIPVAGVSARELFDTWGASRSEGRTHQGIDIIAPLNSEVRAVADGRIVKFFDSERGGVTIYQFDESERFVFYYAHLDARAPGLAEGDYVHQGDRIGFVGKTGNASTPHLHFEIQRLTPERRWWEANSINPYSYLRDGRAPD